MPGRCYCAFSADQSVTVRTPQYYRWVDANLPRGGLPRRSAFNGVKLPSLLQYEINRPDFATSAVLQEDSFGDGGFDVWQMDRACCMSGPDDGDVGRLHRGAAASLSSGVLLSVSLL